MRDQTLYLIVGRHKIPIDLSAYSIGYGIIEARSHDQTIGFRIVCDDYKAMAETLLEMTNRVRGRSVAEVGPGIIHDDSSSDDFFQFDRKPKLEDIPAGDPVTAWKMIWLRFKDSPHGELAGLAQYAAEKYYSLIKREDKIQTIENKLATAEQSAAADLQAVAHLDLILDGKPVWGAQSRIAEALGISNAGQANRDRILAVLDALVSQQQKAA